MKISDKAGGAVYRLVDPIDNRVRYIGQTVGKLSDRLKKHVCDSKRIDTHVARWVKKLLSEGRRPFIEPICVVPTDILDDCEIFYISLYRNSGCDLTNTALGGQSKKVFSVETRNKISQTLMGHKQSAETIEKRRRTLLKTWQSPELRELKRQQTNHLVSIGVLNQKGKVSKKKGRPFEGDKKKLSDSLKRHYSINKSHSRFIFPDENSLIAEYNNHDIPLIEIAKKYNCNRTTITNFIKREGLGFRKRSKKQLS